MTTDANQTSTFAYRRADGFLAGQRPWREMPGFDLSPGDGPMPLALTVAAHRLHRWELTAAIQALADMSGQPGVAAALHGLAKGDVETAEVLLAAEASRLADAGQVADAARFFRHMAAFLWLTDPVAATAPLDQALDLVNGVAVDWPCLMMRALLAVAFSGPDALDALAQEHAVLAGSAPAGDDRGSLALAWHMAGRDDLAAEMLPGLDDAGDVPAMSPWCEICRALIAGTGLPNGIPAFDDPEMVIWADLLFNPAASARHGELPPEIVDPMLVDMLTPAGATADMIDRLQQYLPRLLGYAVIGGVVAAAYFFITG